MTWRQIRKDVLERDHWRCCDCGEAIKGRDAHVHHKLPRALGGDDTPENLISLCSGCHSLKHMNLQASLGRTAQTQISHQTWDPPYARIVRLLNRKNLRRDWRSPYALQHKTCGPYASILLLQSPDDQRR